MTTVADIAETTRLKLLFENIAKKGWNDARLILGHFKDVPMIIHQDPDHWLVYMIYGSTPDQRFEDPVAYWIFKDGCLHCLKKLRPEKSQ